MVPGSKRAVERSLSVLSLPVQFCLGAVGIFEMDIDLVGIEGERPKLHFAVPQYPALDHKGTRVHPTPLGGIDPVSRVRAFAKDSVKSKQPEKMPDWPLGLAGLGRDRPRRIRIGEVQDERRYLQDVCFANSGVSPSGDGRSAAA